MNKLYLIIAGVIALMIFQAYARGGGWALSRAHEKKKHHPRKDLLKSRDRFQKYRDLQFGKGEHAPYALM